MQMRAPLIASPLLAVLSLVACGQTALGVRESGFRIQVPVLFEQCASLDGKSLAKDIAQDLGDLQSAGLKTRTEAAGRLAGRCDRRAVAPLVTMLREDKEALGRAAAARALGMLGDRAAIDSMRESISDPAWQVRLELGPALCSFHVHRASYDVLNSLVNPMTTVVSEDGDLYARCQAILAINQLRDVNFSRKAVHFLFSLSDAPEMKDPARREMILATLTELKNTRNGPHELVGVLKQSLNPMYRIKAAEWIGRLGIASGREALTEVVSTDRDPRVREAATRALAQLKQ